MTITLWATFTVMLTFCLLGSLKKVLNQHGMSDQLCLYFSLQTLHSPSGITSAHADISQNMSWSHTQMSAGDVCSFIENSATALWQNDVSLRAILLQSTLGTPAVNICRVYLYFHWDGCVATNLTPCALDYLIL
jgi:hypothetical protein